MNHHRTPPAVLQLRVLEALLAGPLELEQVVNAIDDADGDIRTAAREVYAAGYVTTRSTPHGTFGVLHELTDAGRALAAPKPLEAEESDDDGPDERPCSCGHDECGAC